MNNYDIGDVVNSAAAFVDADGTAVDPSTVTFKIKEPDGAITTYESGIDTELVNSAVGSYHVLWTNRMAGIHFVRWTSTGTGASSQEGKWNVIERVVE